MLSLRYDRQLRISGWNQEKISRLKVGVVGGDYGAYYTLLPLVSMGVGERGEIRILASDIKRDTLLDQKINIGSDLVWLLLKINPLLSKRINYFRVDLIRDELSIFLNDLDLIIDTTNNPVSKAVAFKYAMKNNVKYISFSTAPCYGRMHVIWDYSNLSIDKIDIDFFLPEFKLLQQEEIISILFGGLASGTLSNYASNRKQGNEEIIYNLLSVNRREKPKFHDPHSMALRYKYRDPLNVDFTDKTVVMIGAGALGNPVAIAMAKMQVGKLVIIDYDTIEETNLNRQYCYYDSVNLNKAEVLARKVSIMSGGVTKTIPVKKKFTLNDARNKDLRSIFEKADLILVLVDNFDARADAADLAEELNKPLISAGTSPFTGHVAVYIPGRTRNLNDVMRYRDHASKTDRLRCIEVHEPSVVTTNQVIGALVALESLKVLKPDMYGSPVIRPITYYSYIRGRFEL